MIDANVAWDPTLIGNSSPCIQVLIQNSPELIPDDVKQLLSVPPSTPVMALLDTGASFSIISRVFAERFKLFQTGDFISIRTLSGTHLAREYAASVSFPGTTLQTFPMLRLRSADFVKEPNFSCLIGRDILQHWRITFDGRSKRVTIEDRR